MNVIMLRINTIFEGEHVYSRNNQRYIAYYKAVINVNQLIICYETDLNNKCENTSEKIEERDKEREGEVHKTKAGTKILTDALWTFHL